MNPLGPPARAPLDRAALARSLSPLGFRPVVLGTTISTNDDAKRLARAGEPAGLVVVAERQTAGRGRFGRAWHAPPGESLTASWLFRPAIEARTVPVVALAAGLAVADAVDDALGAARAAIKWPNDVLVAGRKLAGVLVEATFAGERLEAVVVGIGVNVHTAQFPEELAPFATSLALEGAPSPDRARLLASLSLALGAWLDRLVREGPSGVAAALRSRDALLGREIVLDGVAFTAAGIDDEGRLLARAADGTVRAVASGEVTIGSANAGHPTRR